MRTVTTGADIAPSAHRLESSLRPLQVIVALSSVAFVLSFAFEIFYSFQAQFAQLLLLLALIVSLSFWALAECLLLVRRQARQQFLGLLVPLVVQLCLPFARSFLLLLDPALMQSDWIQGARITSGWHYLFLIPVSLVFLWIHKTIVNLFTLKERVRAINTERQMLSALNAMAMARDNETGNHILRTQNYVRCLAMRLKEMGIERELLSNAFIDLLFAAAPLHDVGKVGIPDQILHKNASLSPEEWEVMQTHTTIGESILSSASSKLGKADDVLDVAIMIAGGHHEKWDGTGYPRGLQGRSIPLAARIMALADIYDALVSERVYKDAWTHETAAQEIMRLSGSHLDPDVVQAFVAEQDSFQRIAAQYKD